MDQIIKKVIDYIDQKKESNEIITRDFVEKIATEMNLKIADDVVDKVLIHFGINPIDEAQTVIVDKLNDELPLTSQAEGIDDAKPGSAEKYPKQFRPSCFKMPMNKDRIHERKILDFEGFMKKIAYRTHDGQSDETTQRGHGQNLSGK